MSEFVRFKCVRFKRVRFKRFSMIIWS